MALLRTLSVCSDAVITIGISGNPYVLFIDPFAWHFELTPAAIAAAVRWAVKNGWTPDQGPTKAMSIDGKTNAFVWLPDGRRHLHCKPQS